MELSRSNIKKFQETETLTRFLIFLETEPFSPPQENFLYFRKWKHQKFSYIFSKENFSYFLAMETSKKFLIFQEMELPYVLGKVYSEP